MIDEPLAEAYIHRRHTVMWRRLRPLTLRRFFVLLIANSPLLDGNRDVTWGDLEAAVTICAVRDALRAFTNLTRYRTLRGRILRRARPQALEHHACKFLAYVADYHATPASDESPGGKMAKAPWILRIVETLRRNGYRKRWYHIWHDPAWDMETGQAFHIYATLMELDGHETSLLDPEDKELLALSREADVVRTALTPEVSHG